MPDWSYHLLFKPVLSHLSSFYSREFIHRGMNQIASIPGGKHIINFLGREESSHLLEKEVQQVHFPNSIGLSGKLDPLLSGTKAFSNLGFGFLEIGPVTKAKIDGEVPTINHQQQMIEYPAQFESIGIDETIEKLSKLSTQQPIMIRLYGSEDEQLELIMMHDSFADAFIIDSRHFKEAVPDLLTKNKRTNKPIYLSVPAGNVKELSPEFVNNHFSGIVLDEMPNLSDEMNLSGHLDALQYLRKNHFTKPIITSGGVREPGDALKLLDAQADLIMLSGGYVLSGPGLVKRIKEAQLYNLNQDKNCSTGWGWYFVFGLSMMIGGIIALLISMTTVILAYDEYFLGMTRETILAYNERILHFMAHDRMTLAGTIISGGIIYMFLAICGVRKGLLWAKQATDIAAMIGFLGIFLFIGYGYFDWLHQLFWLVLAPFYILGFIKTKHIQETPSSTNKWNHRLWKRSLLGQLAFVILGFSFVLGGMIISYIGISNIFVETDLHYISMTPGTVHAFNERLIPVIAHDRAGFGSALLSVGLLVLMLSLWGFQQGNKWLWWTLCIGGIPAFATGIGVHFAIGYTTFIHLLPAYFALGLYSVGLATTFHFFHKQKD
jgi:dihydroorotate dehydrogenase